MSTISLPIIIEKDDEERPSPHIDHLRRCEVCGEIRHKTWFDVGSRGCYECEYSINAVAFAMAMNDKSRIN